MKKVILTCLFGLLLGLVTTQAEETKEAKKDDATPVKEVAVIKTSAGTMVIEFWTDAAPEDDRKF